MSWQILIFFSVLSGAIGEVGQKISVSSKQNLRSETVNFLVATLQLLFSLVFVFLTDQKLPKLTLEQSFLLILSSVLGFFFFKFLYQSYKGSSASISQIIFSFSVVLTTVFGIVFFEESTELLKFFGILLILSALFVVNYSKQGKLSRYNIYALTAAFIFAIITNIDKSFSIDINVHWYQVISVFGFVIISLLLAGRAIKSDLKNIKPIDFKSILISAISFTIFNKLTFLAFLNGAEVGKVDAINNTIVFVIILLEYFVLKEKENIRRKLIGGSLAFLGVLLLV